MSTLNRRQFLTTAAAAGVLAARRSHAAESEPPIRVAVIGCGWFGNEHLKAMFKLGGVEVVALCDVDSEHLKKTADTVEKELGQRPRLFKDYRECLESDGLQAVFIATPPHWHALPFIAACEQGLDIYCEKPLSYDVREGQAMVEAAQKAKNIVQIGFQRRQSDAIKATRDHIARGNAGRVVQVDARIHYKAGRKSRKPTPPPDSLDWEFWCGPAPRLAHSEAVGHFHWRLEKEYGNGHLVDWGIHLIDATRYILGETMPRSIHAAGGIYVLGDHITTPDALTVHFEFEACPVVWRHRIWGATEYRPEVNNGIFFYCEKETIFATDTKWMIIPNGKDAEPIVHEAIVKGDDLVTQNVGDFVKSVRSRQQPGVKPADAFQSTATVQLAMIAYETASTVRWDAQRNEITDNPAGVRLLKRDYRHPWQHPWSG